jgi:hypothetical protein
MNQPTNPRRRSYTTGEPDSAPELVRFITCRTVDELKSIDIKDLFTAAAQGQNTIAEWEATIVGHLQRIEDLEAEVRTKTGIISYLETREGQPYHTPTKEIDVPVPELSDNKNPTFENWRAQIEGKFDVNKKLFTTERAKIVFLFGRTAGDVQAHLQPRYNDNEGCFLTAQDMIDHLASIYVDPHKTSNARLEFRKLNMRPANAFSEFYTKFLHLAGAGKVAAEDYRTDLYDKLTIELQKAVLPTYNTLTTH